MKIFKYVLLVTVTMLFIGCGEQPKPPEKVYIYKTKVVVKEVGCKVPEVKCDFKGKGFTPTAKLLECVILQKRVLDSLREQSKKLNKK